MHSVFEFNCGGLTVLTFDGTESSEVQNEGSYHSGLAVS